MRRINSIFIGLFIALIFTGISANTFAQVPMVKTQAPGYFRYMLGQFEITALYDGPIVVNTTILKSAPQEEIDGVVKSNYSNPEKIKMSVNAYLVNTGKNLVLIDVGAAKVFGPDLGSVISNLIASGYKPEQVDAILITHMHGDHIGGLINADGKPAFPNAVVYSSKEEKDFWYSDAIADKAPENFKPAFKMVRDLMNPYVTAGKYKNISGGQEVVPGIKAVDIKGHTAGHMAYEILSGTESLLMIGDMVHVMQAQLKRPDVTIIFDSDQKQAAATRLEMFKNISKNGTLIAASHLPFPGIGHLAADGNKGYLWMPVEY